MRAIPLIVIVLAMSAGCCSLKSYEDMRERAQVAEKALEEQQLFVAGCQDDNAMLQKYGIELGNELRRWQMGSVLQAMREAELRAACDV